MTELDKLDCAEYMLDLLVDAITDNGSYDCELGTWMVRAKAECDKRRGQYLVVDAPIAPKGEEDEQAGYA